MFRNLLFALLLFPTLLSAQYRRVSGFVADSTRAPIPDVSIFITNGSIVATTDASGYYSCELRTGEYELVFNHPNYQRVRIKVVLQQKDDTVNVIMPGLIKTLNTVEITRKWTDPGPEMMRKAIAKRDYWATRLPSYSAEMYIRAFEEYQKPKKVENVWHEEPTAEVKAAKKKKEQEETPQSSLAEIILQRDWMPPGKVKETRIGINKYGDIDGLFYTTTTDGDFNLYQNLVPTRGLGDMPVMSPLSNTALLAYKFNFLGSYKDESGRRILKIKMSPRSISNSVFSGEIHIVDTLFYIYRAELNYPANQLNEYDKFITSAEYKLTPDSFLLFDRIRFDYFAKAGKGKYNGYTLVNFKKYEVNKTFPKNHFGLEVSRSLDSAYSRDSSFWKENRASPLNTNEIKFITRTDSLKRITESKEYLDSMQKETNKVTLRKLFLNGQQYQNRNKGLNIDFQPLLFIVQPWFPGGTRISLWNTFEKEFKNKRSFRIDENLSYGINNKDIRGTVGFSTLFDPYHRGNLYISAGRDFGFINPQAAFLDLARRNNFYQNTHLDIFVRRELINGLYLRVRGNISDRKDISQFKFDSFSDSLFGPDNRPAVFEDNRALFAEFELSYTPGQRYIREPKQKIILGSRWPTFTVNYKQALPGVFKTDIDYSFLEYRIEQEIPMGLLGRSELRATSGAFIYYNKLSPVDFRYQRRGDIAVFTPPMYAFQTLDSTFETRKRFYEVHYRHHFNGAIINKIPFMRFLKIRESAGVNLLYAPERRNMFFYEAYVGVDKLVRIWRERFKLGVYYCAGYSNIYEKPIFGLKLNFEYFDRRNNSW
jgi:hypothetical protein